MYQYKAICIRVIDGDTLRLSISLGFDIWVKQTIRLSGVDAPEVRGEERESGLRATAYLTERLLGKTVTVHTFKAPGLEDPRFERDKQGKYGRYLGEVWLNDENINSTLVREGYAKVWE